MNFFEKNLKIMLFRYKKVRDRIYEEQFKEYKKYEAKVHFLLK
ncbi:hypothetical protein [Priestia endophytica]|jgi:hypothetical protein|nr:hypothetical protein [Priestia endophytica]RPK15736.1 hypothetical protein FH5_01171 [Priestia endophytica]